jgi:hypothetical protein
VEKTVIHPTPTCRQYQLIPRPNSIPLDIATSHPDSLCPLSVPFPLSVYGRYEAVVREKEDLANKLDSTGGSTGHSGSGRATPPIMSTSTAEQKYLVRLRSPNGDNGLSGTQ